MLSRQKKMTKEVAFGILQSWIWSHRRLLTPSAHFDLFYFICHRTIRFHKFSDRILPEHFIKGVISPDSNFIMPGLPQSGKTIQNIKPRIIENRLVFRPKNKKQFIVNVWGIIELFKEYLHPYINEREAKAFDLLLAMFKKEHPDFYEREEIQPMEEGKRSIETLAQAGMEKSKAAKERIKQKKLKKPRSTLNSNDVKVLFKALVEEYYGGYEYTESWIQEMYGSATNWLKYARERNQTPQDILREVIENWESIVIQDQWGNPIQLSLYPKFKEYFKYREKIHDWLASHSDESKEDEIEESANIKRIKL
jgi:hypothetical protein